MIPIIVTIRVDIPMNRVQKFIRLNENNLLEFPVEFVMRCVSSNILCKRNPLIK